LSRTIQLAKYIFSDDLNVPDTVKILREVKEKKFVIFKSTWIVDCLGRDSSSCQPIENYLLLPPQAEEATDDTVNEEEDEIETSQDSLHGGDNIASSPKPLYDGDKTTEYPKRRCLSPIEINNKLGKENLNHFATSPLTSHPPNVVISPIRSQMTSQNCVTMTSPISPDVIDGDLLKSSQKSKRETLEKHREMIQKKQMAVNSSSTPASFLYGAFAGFPHLDDLVIPTAKLTDFLVDKDGCQVKLRM